jgi:hypothetical protein
MRLGKAEQRHSLCDFQTVCSCSLPFSAALSNGLIAYSEWFQTADARFDGRLQFFCVAVNLYEALLSALGRLQVKGL